MSVVKAQDRIRHLHSGFGAPSKTTNAYAQGYDLEVEGEGEDSQGTIMLNNTSTLNSNVQTSYLDKATTDYWKMKNARKRGRRHGQ